MLHLFAWEFSLKEVSKAVWGCLYGEEMGGMEKLEKWDSHGLTCSLGPQTRVKPNGEIGYKPGPKGMFLQETL